MLRDFSLTFASELAQRELSEESLYSLLGGNQVDKRCQLLEEKDATSKLYRADILPRNKHGFSRQFLRLLIGVRRANSEPFELGYDFLSRQAFRWLLETEDILKPTDYEIFGGNDPFYTSDRAVFIDPVLFLERNAPLICRLFRSQFHRTFIKPTDVYDDHNDN